MVFASRKMRATVQRISGILLCFCASAVLSDSFSIPNDLLNGYCPTEPAICIDAQSVNCSNTKYRTIDGSCNNPHNPTLGMSYSSFARIIAPDYSDNIYEFRTAVDGSPLPSARLLSYKVFGRQRIPDPRFTWINMQWGQAVAHDISLRAPEGFPGTKPLTATPQRCCSAEGRYEWVTISTPCAPIPVPRDDPFFRNWECIYFDRTITDKQQGCPGSEDPYPADQISAVTAYLDLSLVYGNTDTESKKLRTMQCGLLRTYQEQGDFPPHTDRKGGSIFCSRDPDDNTCYEFGDLRGNQNPGIVMLHIVLLREHNRIASELSRINPQWDDETLFQEARRINIAQFQQITYYEWAPLYLGSDRMKYHRIIYDTNGGEHVNDYNPCVDPRTTQSFGQGAFRNFHDQIFGLIKMYTEQREELAQVLRLSKIADRPGFIETGCKYASLIRGLATQPQKQTDHNIDIEVAELFPIGRNNLGRDLRAFDIQRGRDHGLASYNAHREFCGLPRARTWSDFSDYISQEDIDVLRGIYEHPDDVDLIVGGALEEHLPNSLLGPTFLCLNIIDAYQTRVGDRYFFESSDQPNPFTREQLTEIRKATVSRVLCDNSDVENMQPTGFKIISNRNPLRPCSSLPKIDLSKWKSRRS